MKKILSMVVMVLLGVSSVWAEQVTVNLYHSEETTTSPYIDQSVSGACNPIGSLWGDGYMSINLQPTKPGTMQTTTNEAELTLSTKLGTVIKDYAFELVKHTTLLPLDIS